MCTVCTALGVPTEVVGAVELVSVSAVTVCITGVAAL
jgi:hypothetical protein